MPKGPADETKFRTEEAAPNDGPNFKTGFGSPPDAARYAETRSYSAAPRGGGGIGAAIVVLLILGAIGAAVWYFFLR